MPVYNGPMRRTPEGRSRGDAFVLVQSDPEWPPQDSNSRPRPLLLPSWYHLSNLLRWYQEGNNKGLGFEFESREAILGRFWH